MCYVVLLMLIVIVLMTFRSNTATTTNEVMLGIGLYYLPAGQYNSDGVP